jgi:hypothetical protein
MKQILDQLEINTLQAEIKRLQEQQRCNFQFERCDEISRLRFKLKLILDQY